MHLLSLKVWHLVTPIFHFPWLFQKIVSPDLSWPPKFHDFFQFSRWQVCRAKNKQLAAAHILSACRRQGTSAGDNTGSDCDSASWSDTPCCLDTSNQAVSWCSAWRSPYIPRSWSHHSDDLPTITTILISAVRIVFSSFRIESISWAIIWNFESNRIVIIRLKSHQ